MKTQVLLQIQWYFNKMRRWKTTILLTMVQLLTVPSSFPEQKQSKFPLYLIMNFHLQRLVFKIPRVEILNAFPLAFELGKSPLSARFRRMVIPPSGTSTKRGAASLPRWQRLRCNSQSTAT
jgi:hypothetical protein